MSIVNIQEIKFNIMSMTNQKKKKMTTFCNNKKKLLLLLQVKSKS